MSRTRHHLRSLLGALVLAAVTGCTPYEPFDSAKALREEVGERAGGVEEQIEVPFELSGEVEKAVDERLAKTGSEKERVDRVLDFIFNQLGLEYSLVPTRDAVETYRTRHGNCLSFVNLFVGLAREQRLAPFYVEVNDQQRWNYRDGMVISQGHIVAGMYFSGKLRTFDFLPYRPKSYRNFQPIDDVKATAHFYNNLGGEALMGGDTARALEMLRIATSIAPKFTKALNNLGVALARSGASEEAVAVYHKGLEISPEDVALLSNLARVYQESGRGAEATQLLARIETSNTTNPFFFVYQGEKALAEGKLKKALEYMREALRVDSEVPEVHVGLVKVYLALGEVDKARHHLERALQLDATHQEARRLATMLNR